MRLTRPGADAAARGATANVARNNADALSRMGLTRIGANVTLYQPFPPPVLKPSRAIRMRRSAGYALFVFAGFPALLGAQGFGIYEQGTCSMGRAGTGVAAPCADGSAIFFNPAGLAGVKGAHLTVGATLLDVQGGFTDDIFQLKSDLDDPLLIVPGTFGQFGIAPGTDFANAHLEATKTTVAAHFGAIVKVNDQLSFGARFLTQAKFDYSGTASFTQVPTGLIVPADIVVTPTDTIHAGTPIDGLLGPAGLDLFNASTGVFRSQ